MALETSQSFGQVIDACKMGNYAQRSGWNGKNMYIHIVNYTNRIDKPLKLSHFNMINAKGNIVVGWLASQEDMLADDWTIADRSQEFTNPRSKAESGQQ